MFKSREYNEIRDKLVALKKQEEQLLEQMGDLLVGTDVVMKYGDYRGRKAQITECSHGFRGDPLTLRVAIYRIDSKKGFPGSEGFIYYNCPYFTEEYFEPVGDSAEGYAG